MDPYSWRLLKNLVETEHIVFVFTVEEHSTVTCVHDGLIQMRAQYWLNLKGFSPDLIVPIICWFLEVEAVHNTIINFLKIHVSDNSQLLEEILLCPSFINLLRIVPKSSINQATLEKCFQVSGNVQLREVQDSSGSDPGDSRVCDIKPDVELTRLLLSYNFEAAVKERLNILGIQERVVLKRAAILGFSFIYHCLETANADLSPSSVTLSVQNLVRQNILSFHSSSDIYSDSRYVSKKHPILVRIKTELGYICTKVLPLGKYPDRKSFFPTQKLQFSTMAFRSFILQNMTKDQRHTMHIEVIKQLEVDGLTCSECKQQLVVFHRRRSHDHSQADSNGQSKSKGRHCHRCLQLPTFDLRKCECLTYRGNVYGKISAVYAGLRSSVNSIVFLIKASETFLQMKNPMMALVYMRWAMRLFNPSIIRRESFQSGIEVTPSVINAALLRVQAEALLLLNSNYDAANMAMKALGLLELSILDFVGCKKGNKRVLDIITKSSEVLCQEVERNLFILCKSYLAVKEYKLAFQISKSIMYILTSEKDSFYQLLKAEVLFYTCKSHYNPIASESNLEHSILHLCHERLMDATSVVDYLEIKGIAKAYKAVVEQNLNKRNLMRAEYVCTEAFRLLKSVSENEDLPYILTLGVQTCLHSRRFGSLLNYLNNLRAISIETGNKVFLAVFYCCVIAVSGDRVARISYTERLSEFNEYIQSTRDLNISWSPRDLSYFAAAKLALWCLQERVANDEQLWVDTFCHWFKLARMLRNKDMDSYWFVGAELAMIRIRTIISFRVMNLSYEEKEEEFDKIEEELKKMRFTVKAKYPVFDHMWEELIADLIHLLPEISPELTGIKRYYEKTAWFEHVEFMNML